MNTLSKICWLGAALYAVAGVGFGIAMSASGDHTLSPAHGHLNLLGWASLALYGGFYSLYPVAARGFLPRMQVALAHLGVIVLTPGIALAIRGEGEALAKGGSLIVLVSMLTFLAIVAMQSRRAPGAA